MRITVWVGTALKMNGLNGRKGRKVCGEGLAVGSCPGRQSRRRCRSVLLNSVMEDAGLPGFLSRKV